MKILLIILWFFIVIILIIVIFVHFHPILGSKTINIIDSKNILHGKFQNIHKTSVNTWDWGILWVVKQYIINKEERTPWPVLKTYKIEKNSFWNWDIVWLWHSTILMNIDNKNVITDPVFYKASPIFIGWKPFKYSNPPQISDLPKLDVVVISHDHYDHLDYKAILELDEKVWEYLVPLWVSSHLEKWWVDINKITEFDWYDEKIIWAVNFVFTPSQHFSWRRLTNRDSTLWWSWVIKSQKQSYFFSGDTGYFDEFKKIWENYWPFDIAFLENGAYNEAWSEIHMLPEDSVQTGIDLNATHLMPIHWGKFDLSLHAWYEPISRFIVAAEEKNISYFHPEIGKSFTINNLPRTNWWQKYIAVEKK